MPLRTAKSPFSVKVKDEGVTTWVKPTLVAEVRFSEWIKAGEMRHPGLPRAKSGQAGQGCCAGTGNAARLGHLPGAALG
jgi:ATP-dependent DNA ligase